MKRFKKIVVSCVAVTFVLLQVAEAQKLTMKSPDGRTELSVNLDETVNYSVTHGGKLVLDKSAIGLKLSDGRMLGSKPKLASKKERSASEEVKSPFYRSSVIKAGYSELDIKLKDGLGILFRTYNQGVAYRFYTTFKNEITIADEVAQFNFDADYTAYLSHTTNTNDQFAMAFQNIYEVKPLSQSDSTLAFLPVTVDLTNGKKLTITESDLEAYPGMFVRADQSAKALNGVFAPYPSKSDIHTWRYVQYVTERDNYIARTAGKRVFPWRILAISDNDTEMPVNDLVYLLASPNRIGDYSWVKPGKVAWDWWNNWGVYGVDFQVGINMDTYKHYVDFASRYGIEYVILDEGWYDTQNGNMMKVVPQLDLPELIAYGKSKGVGIVLWTVFNVLDSQLDIACEHYSKMGAKGFKVDFLDRDDQTAVEMTYRIAEATAKHHLFLDLHGFYKPTGLNRTYPHIINFEGVFGMEEAKWSSIDKNMPQYDVTFPFIRMMAGPVDFTPGAMRNATHGDFRPIYSNPMSQGTRCHQLAMYVVHDSPLTMLCDAPTLYDLEPQYTAFVASIPVETDETKILAGEMGHYIVSARRKATTWHVGGMTNWGEREVKVDFSFLKPNQKYRATIMSDGVNAHRQASDYRVEELTVDSKSYISVSMVSGGGFVIRLEETDKVSTVPMSLSISPFYKKYIDADGIPVVSSHHVDNKAHYVTKQVINLMLSKRADVKKAMVDKKCKVMIIGQNENVCDLPEYAHVCNTPENISFLNKRARGFGGAPEDATSASFGEENVLCLDGDRYRGESILVHEFAHIIHTIGIVGVNPDFDNQLETLRRKAEAKGLWKDTYALSDMYEYFAEAVQSFFNCNRYSEKPDGVHNDINTREKLKNYDPEMYNLLLQYFPEVDLDLCR